MNPDSISDEVRNLHTLLCHVSAVSRVPWSGRELNDAEVRYREIFLPMLATHLFHEKKIILNPAMKSKIELILRRVKEHFVKGKLKALDYAKKWNVSPEKMPRFMEPFSFFEKAGSLAAAHPVPPIDVAYIWTIHRIDRGKYEDDCRKIFGTVLPDDEEVAFHLKFIDAFNAEENSNVSYRLQWACFASALAGMKSKSMFRKNEVTNKIFLPFYTWPGMKNENSITYFVEYNTIYSVGNFLKTDAFDDLKYQAMQQKHYSESMTDPDYFKNENTENAIERYKKFSILAAKYRDTKLYPSYKVNLLRQVRSLQSYKYGEEFCETNFGPDFPIVRNIQDASFQQTLDLWEKEFSEKYYNSVQVDPGSTVNLKRKVSKLLVEYDYGKTMDFYRDVVSGECKTRTRIVDMKITSQNNANIAFGILRFNHVEGGGGPSMFVQGHCVAAAIAREPKGGTGVIKVGAGVNKASTALGVEALFMYAGFYAFS